MAGKKKASLAAASTSGVKRIRNESAAEVDEDAFEAAPYKARMKHAAPASVAEAYAPGELLDQCRICPRVFVEAMKGLNDKQRRAVQALGFGNLFHLPCCIRCIAKSLFPRPFWQPPNGHQIQPP